MDYKIFSFAFSFQDALLSSSASIDMSAIPFEESENLTWLKAESQPNGHQISESDLSLQLSATRRFLLGSDYPVQSPTSSSQLSDAGVHCSSGTSIVEANIVLRNENSTDWMGTEPLSAGNNTYTPDFLGSWFDHSQFESSVGMYSSLTVAQEQRFSIHEICPEWAFAFESTKVHCRKLKVVITYIICVFFYFDSCVQGWIQ